MPAMRLSRKGKRARLLRAVEHYAKLYQMHAWQFKYVFYNTLDDFDDPAEKCTASCEASPEYKEATLTFTLDQIKPEEINQLVAHELVHAILWPMTHFMDRWAGEDPERKEASRFVLETVTTDLDRILYQTLPTPEELDDAAKVRERAGSEPVRGEDSQESQEG